MKWGLVCKPKIAHVYKETMAIYDELKRQKQEVQAEAELAEQAGIEGAPLEKMDADVYVAVGGDGTMLLVLEHTEQPVLGINAGGVGFLTEIEPKYALSAIKRIRAKEFEVEVRKRITPYLNDKQLPDAVNEVTVQTAKIAKLIKFRISVDDEVVDTIRGDGIIVATSTGSTGYALSVGGPILHPSVQGLVLAPIAPFRLAARSFVVSDSSRVQVKLLERMSRTDVDVARVVVDGQHAFPLPPGGITTMEPSVRVSRMIRFHKNFYGRVRTKLIR